MNDFKGLIHWLSVYPLVKMPSTPNSLCSNVFLEWHRSGSSLAQVMGWWLRISSHYLNPSKLLIKDVVVFTISQQVFMNLIWIMASKTLWKLLPHVCTRGQGITGCYTLFDNISGPPFHIYCFYSTFQSSALWLSWLFIALWIWYRKMNWPSLVLIMICTSCY